MKYSGARILVESLIENGVDTIFGYPGSAVLDIYDELYRYRDRIRHILVSHEQHAVHAADGYARSSGRIGVCLATSGPGATNLITGIATAFVDSIPVVAITGNVSIPLLGKDSFQEVDIAGITMPIVKHNWIVKSIHDLADIVREAFIIAKSGRPGPVLIDIPKDISCDTLNFNGLKEKSITGVRNRTMFADSPRARRFIEKTARKTFTKADIEKAVTLIGDSKCPLFYAGGGVVSSGASTLVKKLAEHINAPVALSLMGMGAFPCEHPLCTGLIGMHGTTASNRAVQKADVLIAVGVRFSDRVTNSVRRFAGKAKIIHIDIDPAEINKNINADVCITGDLKVVLESLLKKIPARLPAEWNSEVQKWKAAIQKDHLPGNYRKIALHPYFIIREVARALGEKAIIAADAGQHQIWTAQFYPFILPHSFLCSGGMGTMGFGLGAAAGAKIANPHSPVVLFTGDGSFRMNCSEMATLVKYGLSVLIVVFNNQNLGMLHQWQKSFYDGRYFQTSLDNLGPDFVKLAYAYNVDGFRVTDESSFLEALDKSIKLLAGGKPALIEAVIGRDEKVIPNNTRN